MIEFLSNEQFLKPQIDFLLFLQNLRLEQSVEFNNFVMSITRFGELLYPTMLCALIYWCIDTKAGLYLFSVSSLGTFFAQFLKMVACVYRPWILSDKIHPFGNATYTAQGYSFPSGHSSQASALFGSFAVLCRKRKILVFLFVLFALLVGLSRMWLGVHTPQDVITGLTIGFSLAVFMKKFFDYCEKDKKRYLYSLIVIDIVIAAALVYIYYFNVYPKDYLNGQLIYDPCYAIKDCIHCNSYVLGIVNGAFVCRALFPFEAKSASLTAKIIRGVTGLLLLYFFFNKLCYLLFASGKLSFPMSIAGLILLGFTITAIYPFIFTKIIKIK